MVNDASKCCYLIIHICAVIKRLVLPGGLTTYSHKTLSVFLHVSLESRTTNGWKLKHFRACTQADPYYK